MDFTQPGNSCLVGYTMRRVTSDDHLLYRPAETLYRPGLVWAEPDVELAARWMRLLYENPQLRAEIGARGAETIRRDYSAASQATAVRERVQQIMLRLSP
jgi:hypothetical protein